MKLQRIGVVMGGSSSEREVSLRSGRAVLQALRAAGQEAVALELPANAEPFSALSAANIDVAFLALHGQLGEDGCIQGLLECLGIPYTGSSVLASALAMDKLKAKELFRLHNVATPPYYVLARGQQGELQRWHGAFGFPVVVKPRREGSSFGVSRANDLAELAAAVELALGFDEHALIERYIAGQEVHVGILGERVLGAIEIAAPGGLFDYAAKYSPGRAEYHLPARLSAVRLQSVLTLAERASRALGTSGAVRVDLIVSEGHNEYVLEVNTLPGMTETSLLPKIAHAAGYDFTALCLALLDRAQLHSAKRAPVASAPLPELDVQCPPVAGYGRVG